MLNKMIHLQGVGAVRGKEAKDIRAGDVIMWNYGYTSLVLDNPTLSKSGKSVTVVFKDTHNGKIHDRQFRINKTVAIEKEGE